MNDLINVNKSMSARQNGNVSGLAESSPAEIQVLDPTQRGKNATTDDTPRINVYNLGHVQKESWQTLAQISGIPDMSIKNINKHLVGEPQYLNGAGYPRFPDGTLVTGERSTFILLRTSLKKDDRDEILGWFTRDLKDKHKPNYRGIEWGTSKDFKDFLRFFNSVGRMVFKGKKECKKFFEDLNSKIIPEPWAYKNRPSGDFKYPILKSYLQYELDRLFYESLEYPNKIIYNEAGDMILFNTNLINKYGDDLYIVGNKEIFKDETYISELEIAPAKSRLSEFGFNPNDIPSPPQFFQDINEIVFQPSWRIDDDMAKREHIIEQRINRFPERYRELQPDDLGQKLNNAISLATKFAQRNYKFIVPMYNPNRSYIQLLMPIYLDRAYSNHPDFALVLTPNEKAELYVPETILGLDEVYQNARLIAKPDESWLNPDMIR